MLRSIVVLILGLALAGCASPPTPPTPAAPTPATRPGSGDPSPAAVPPGETPAPIAPPLDVPGIADLGDTRYACEGPPGFLPRTFEQPAAAELEDHPSAAALRAAIGEGGQAVDLPESGYWLVHRDDRSATYLAREPEGDPPFASATIDFDGTAWTLGVWEQCRPAIVLDGLSLATWTLDPDVPPPDASAMTFAAVVTERACTGAKPMGARLQPPSITYGQTSVLVVFAARPLEGDDFDCPGNPSTSVVVQLREPLGSRRLLDAGMFPPVDPIAPEF